MPSLEEIRPRLDFWRNFENSTSSYQPPSVYDDYPTKSYPEKPPPYTPTPSTAYCPSETFSKVPKSAPDTSDDEKVALMLQNQEFLRYLQRDQDFMRELYHDPRRKNDYQRFGNNRSYHKNSRPSPTYFDTWEPAQAVPNGPVVDFSNGSIPNGPVVDYIPDASTSWTGKLKSRLSSRSSSDPRPEDVYPEPAPIVYTCQDENLTDRLKNMSKSSKTKFLTLAKKFTLAKKDPKMLPTIYGDQTTNFTYDIHHRN
uniref:Uncharacterized protein n=1 Tax=Acrobeloides nanus TaxID=290746 RepID=A0A914ELX9_9BILA